MEQNFEKKDLRIGWMNINSACAAIIAARINAGLYKPKNNKEAIQELLDAIQIEFTAFQYIQSHGKEQTSMHPSVPSSDTMNRVCEQCGTKISEKVADYSLRKYSCSLCMECQKDQVKDDTL